MDKAYLAKALAKHITVPAHIIVCANMVRYDLLHGPAFARLPHGDVTQITNDDLATLYSDAEDLRENDDDKIVEVYPSIIGDTLRDFVDDLSSTLYYDDDCGCIMDSEPQGEEIDGEWYEPSDYYTLTGKDIIDGLFGRTIANEFK